MKQFFYIVILFLPCFAWSQYQNNSNQKITLGEQTTADGLIWRGVSNDTNLINPLSDTSAYIILDTINSKLYQYNRATTFWSLAGGGVASVRAITITQNGIGITSTVTDSATNPLLTLNIPNAGMDTRGVVSTSSQTFKGTKTFSNGIYSQGLGLFGNQNADSGFNNILGSVNGSVGFVRITNGLTLSGDSLKNGLVLTTSGSSGAATFNGTTLNIPNYIPSGVPRPTGTVEAIYSGTGINVSPNPITSTGFIHADTNFLITRFDTAAMLAPYAKIGSGGGGFVDTTSALKIPVGTTAERPTSPSNGMIRLNTTIQSPEFYYLGYWIPTNKYSIDYVVVGGGGGGGKTDVSQGSGGGGGAGGYRSSYNLSGGNFSKENPLDLILGVNYNVTIGAGGVGATAFRTRGTSGGNSSFSVITSIGGGGGGGGSLSAVIAGLPGGSGGGASYNGGVGGLGVVNQGYSGGNTSSPYGGGGGGALSIGFTTSSNNSGGGSGIFLDISGVSLEYSKGGNTNSTSVVNGETNTGNGGSSSYSGAYNGGNGGSGIVIIKYSSIYTVSNPGGGLTFSTVVIGIDKITTFTAGTGNIQFN